MPAKSAMTWEPATCRWKKIYKGKSHTVSCRALGTPPTKLDSYQSANAWWQARKAEIDSSTSQPHPHAERLELLSRRLAWAQAHGEVGLARTVQAEHSRYEDDLAGDFLQEKVSPIQLAEVPNELVEPLYESMSSPSLAAETIIRMTDDAVWNARLAHGPSQAVHKDLTLGVQVDRFLALERVRTESSQLSISEFDTIRRCLQAFRDHVGKASPITVLDADRLEDWWSHLMTQVISVEYKKKRLRIARTFVSWLAEKGLIPVPLNLHSRRHRFGGGSRSVPTIPLDEVRILIAQAPGQLKLHLLLMLNCGMTQVDIADLHPREVDWAEGRIKRKRSKTDDHENVPMVEYALWPQTLQLLRKFAVREGDRALLTSSGRPWLRDELRPDGKRSKVDAIKSNYVHLQRKTATSYPMKLFRKTSATLIESHEVHGRYTGHFLGHAPASVAERHYAAPSVDLFDKAISWLGQQYGNHVIANFK